MSELHDPGGKSSFSMPRGIDGNAAFSECGKYRHWLSRDWGLRRFSDGREQYVLWIGMNPSTATGEKDDPTIRREMNFTIRHKYLRYVKANVMDYRATDPKALLTVDAPRSPQNLEVIAELSARASVIVAAWGTLPKKLRHYAAEVVAAIGDKPIHCLGVTADGSPRHPLYLSKNAPMVPWSPYL